MFACAFCILGFEDTFRSVHINWGGCLHVAFACILFPIVGRNRDLFVWIIVLIGRYSFDWHLEILLLLYNDVLYCNCWGRKIHWAFSRFTPTAALMLYLLMKPASYALKWHDSVLHMINLPNTVKPPLYSCSLVGELSWGSPSRYMQR